MKYHIMQKHTESIKPENETNHSEQLQGAYYVDDSVELSDDFDID